jgi:glucans biosynthesis protein C
MDGSTRRYDVDWMRVLGMCAVFLFHCARFFDRDYWHVKDSEQSFVLSIFVGILAQWLMPLFFILSGISSYHALAHRTNGQYVPERFKRLFVPLVFGILVLIPPQVYIERVTRAKFSGSLVDFLPHYFDGFYRFGGNFAWMGLHLWYLEVLFLFSLITLPLFWALKKKAGRGFVSWARLPPVTFSFALPLAIVEVLVNRQPHGIGMREFGGWNILAYLVLLIYGYLIASVGGLQESMERQSVPALVLAVVTTFLGFAMIQFKYSSYSPLFSIVRAFNSWCWLVAIIGLAGRFLRFNSKALPYVNEAVLPFYILHQTVIVIIGYFIASWSVGIVVKYPLLIASSFTVIMLVYELMIRRIALLRFLFGMKPNRRVLKAR